MKRRTFVTTGIWLPSAAAAAWPGVSRTLSRAFSCSRTVAIVDRTLLGGPALARCVEQMNLPVFDPGDDIGTLWYTALSPRLTPESLLIGFARASDYFVIHELASRAGWQADSSDGQRNGAATLAPHAPRIFSFTPRERR